MKNILVTRTDRLGDVILSFPVAAAIKAIDPEVIVTFLVAPSASPAVELCPWIDDHIATPPAGEFRTLAATLKERKFDAAVCLYPRPQIAALLKKARIPLRVGTSRRWYSYRFNRRVRIARANSGRHERDLNLESLRGLRWSNWPTVNPVCTTTQDSLEAVRIMSKKAGVDLAQRASVVVHPGCGGSARNWKPERYRLLCQSLMENNLSVIVTGSTAERDLAESVAGSATDRSISLAGATDLRQLAALLRQARAFVGPSTGPMHLAAAVGTPVVALFGPVRTTGPDRWGPLGDGHRVFVPPIAACNCRVDHCQLGDCMDMIPVGEVAEVVLRVASRSENLHPNTNPDDLPTRIQQT